MKASVMNASQAIEIFVEFFRVRGHSLTPESSLIPGPNDPVLFTTSGMHPLTPYLEGRPHPLGTRLVNVQRCLRTTDLDEIGDPSHLTVFEMLGSWSLGDYDGQQSLRWCHELITGGFGIGPDRLHATVFGGDEQVGPDTGLLRTWQDLGVPVELNRPENWWSNGPTGLCGPDSELFVWTGRSLPSGSPASDERWVELWNHVMLRYRRDGDGRLRPLPRPSVDTGMGLERLLAVLQDKPSVFETDLLEPWLTTLRRLWGPPEPSLRLVSDHLRAAVAVAGDGVRPASSGRGYVLRRLIRRALTALWRDDDLRTLADLPPELVQQTLRHFRQHAAAQSIGQLLIDEQDRFRELLARGRRVLSRRRRTGPLTEDELRYLHDTHGLPPELVTVLQAETS